MSAALVLPFVYAFARPQAELKAPTPQLEPPQPRLAFYRKYTEAVLRRYVRMSMEAGKVPSLLKQEMFRGNVSAGRVTGFDDAVIFITDIDRCLQKLDLRYRDLLSRIAIQGYNFAEAAELLGLSMRTTVRRYGIALDRLTRILVDVKLLHTPNSVNR